MSHEAKEILVMLAAVPVVVVVVSAVCYFWFQAWIWTIVFCLHRAQAWGWWP